MAKRKARKLLLDLNETNLPGQIGAIICWYHSQENDFLTEFDESELEEPLSEMQRRKLLSEMQNEAEEEQQLIGRCVGAIGTILAGRVDEVDTNVLFYIFDALGRYSDRTPELEDVYRAIDQSWCAKGE